jgi:hypothetical protein
LTNAFTAAGKINKVKNITAPANPVVTLLGNKMTWLEVAEAVQYSVLKNGREVQKSGEAFYSIQTNDCAEYQVVALSEYGVPSFASEPILFSEQKAVSQYEIEAVKQKSTLAYKGFSGDGFVEINSKENRTIDIPVTVDQPGVYAINFRYANGNGPVNTENKCAIRTLRVDQKFAGTVIFPQRGKEEWSNWGFSNAVQVTLTKGKHIITVSFSNANDNMNEIVNEAMLDYLQLLKLK